MEGSHTVVNRMDVSKQREAPARIVRGLAWNRTGRLRNRSRQKSLLCEVFRQVNIFFNSFLAITITLNSIY
jgi:hypothetical protein